MKCPKCGATMKEGKLYCEHCGEEIRIVPEFEPEIENSIRATLSDVATQITSRPGEEKEADAPNKTRSSRSLTEKKKRMAKRALSRKRRLLAWAAVVVAAGIALFGGALAGIEHFSPEAQYKKGVKLMEKQRYEDAAQYFERALSLSPTNVAYLNALSGCYLERGMPEEAKAVCQEAVLLEGSNKDAYAMLVKIYSRQEDFESINELMQSCKDQDIRNKYQEYLAVAPDAQAKGGTYHEPTVVKLIGGSKGTIYYTLDGSEPDESSEVYINPISLEAGPYTLKAFFVNQYGVKSEVITEDYYIDVVLPEAPVVLPKSGVYGRPHLIEMEIPEDYQVYYTTDKSDPDRNSTLYEGDLWMPVGHSVLRFVTISPGGICSEITERQYTLDLHPLLSMEAASNQLLLSLKNAGLILNLQGDVPSGQGRNLYTYKYTLTINGHNYYFYREYYEESAGMSNATGKDYVVNYMSGECYEAVQQEDKTFKLYRIEEPDAQDEES